MKEYQIFLQNKYYKNMSADSITKIFVQVSKDIKNNIVSDFDYSQPALVKIIPVI